MYDTPSGVKRVPPSASPRTHHEKNSLDARLQAGWVPGGREDITVVEDFGIESPAELICRAFCHETSSKTAVFCTVLYNKMNWKNSLFPPSPPRDRNFGTF